MSGDHILVEYLNCLRRCELWTGPRENPVGGHAGFRLYTARQRTGGWSASLRTYRPPGRLMMRTSRDRGES